MRIMTTSQSNDFFLFRLSEETEDDDEEHVEGRESKNN